MQGPPGGAAGAAVDATLRQAMALHQAGRLAEAEPLYRQVLAADSRRFEALHFFGVLEAQRGRNEDAHRLIAQSLQVDGTRPEPFVNHARVLIALGRHDEAIKACGRALALNPRAADALTFQGHALRGLGRAADALASYDKVLALVANQPGAFANRANALADLERLDEAVAAYDAALRLAPQFVEAWNGRGMALHRLRRFEEALSSYDRGLQARRDLAELWSNRSATLNALKRHVDALASSDTALRLRPDSADALNNRGIALLEIGRLDEARSTCERALALDAGNARVHYNLANVLRALGRTEEAVAQNDRALALDPGFANAQWNKFLRSMETGRLVEAWPLYEARWKADVTNQAAWRPYAVPLWRGERVGGPLLIWGEQGLGDQILHAGMVPDVQAFAPTLVLEVEARLVPLFARSFPGVEVVPLRPELHSGPVATHVPLGSLGGFLRSDWDCFAVGRSAYLAADAAQTASLRQRLAPEAEHIIGVSWRILSVAFGQSKTARLHDLESVLRLPGCRLVDLQYGDTDRERAALASELGINVEHLPDIDNTNDIDGLAALISACDAVVTVSNTTAHLAGALGRPTWVMVPSGHARLWYWFKDRPDSPWYPRVRVRPQGTGQSWADLVASLAPEVEAAIART